MINILRGGAYLRGHSLEEDTLSRRAIFRGNTVYVSHYSKIDSLSVVDIFHLIPAYVVYRIIFTTVYSTA